MVRAGGIVLPAPPGLPSILLECLPVTFEEEGAEKDIPLLKLEVTAQRSLGQLSGVTTIQRLNAKGGVAEGSCETAGAFLPVPYSADYAFLKKSQ